MRSSVTIFFGAALAGLSAACSTPGNFIVTFYGYPDNSPPGPGTAHNCGGRNYVAGGMMLSQRLLFHRLMILLTGSGTYNDPLTIATAPGELNVCEIVYLPLLAKYGRYEDDCAQCSEYTIHPMP